jgi:hypothetical protein
MATDRTFQATNAQTCERLRALVARLDAADLQRPVGHGWTVAATLVHLAFWDLRAVTLIERFETDGVGPSPADVDVINDTVHALADVIPPRAAARLAVEAAERAHRRIAALPDGTIEAIAVGAPFNLARHPHWTEHLDEIDRVLPPRRGEGRRS